ncbi:hypothetical protein NQ317_017671 [Molorchus minor]|uniref:Uncharacterized protein n=1 Tax=Molorchus minor TaxID=1323400 RepID=A0ABQ9JXK3_9CUCU|nr:hypothetical protein NQ317_017671 [Molorchus minor]
MIRALPTLPEFSLIFPLTLLTKTTVIFPIAQEIDCDYSWNDPSTPDFSRIFPIFPELSRRCDELIATIPETIRALPTFPGIFPIARKPPCLMSFLIFHKESISTIPGDPSTPFQDFPDFLRTLPNARITVFGVFAHIFRSKESIATIPEMIRALPTLPEFSDFSRTLPKARNTVFGIFHYIFRCEESIATIPEMIRALPIFPELSRSLKSPCLVSFLIFSGSGNRLRPFPKRSEPSRLFPNFPDFSRTLPKARNTVFGVFPYIFRLEESIATIPETIRAIPTFPELSRRLETPCLVSFPIFSGSRNRLRLFPKRSEHSPIFPELSRSIKTPCLVSLLIFLGPRNRLQLFLKLIRAFPTFAKRVTAYPLQKNFQAGRCVAAGHAVGSEAATGQRSCPRGRRSRPRQPAELGN